MTNPRNRGLSRIGLLAIIAAAILLAAMAGAVAFLGETGASEPEAPIEGPAEAAKVSTLDPAAVAAAGNEGGSRVVAGTDSDPFGKGSLTTLAFEIVGRVVDTDRKPVKGASVELYVSQWPIVSASMIPSMRENGARVEDYKLKTGVDGVFRFRGPYTDGVDYFIIAKFPERAPVVKRGLVVERGVPCDAGDLTLERGLQLAGAVVGPAGTPVPGAHVGVVSTPSFWAVERFLEQTEPDDWAAADAEGKFEVKNLPEGRYVVLAFAKGLARGATPPITLGKDTVAQPIIVNLAEGASILGSVSSTDGSGIARAKVRVRLSKNPETGNMRGSYRGPGDGGARDVNGEDSLLCDYPISVMTDAAGQFQAEGLVSGSIYSVSASAEGFRKSGDQVVNAGHASVTIALKPNFEIRGTVVDAETGEPISGAQVGRYAGSLDELRRGPWQFPEAKGHSDGQGKFLATYDGKAGGSNILAWFPMTGAMKNPGYAPSISDPFTLVENQPTPEVTVKMSRGSAISGMVASGATGDPVAGVALQLYAVRDPNAPNPRLYNTGSFMGRATADSRGKFTFEGLIPGFYSIEARESTSGGNRSEIVKLGQSDRREGIRIVLPVAGAIRGTIVGNASLSIVKILATRADGLSFMKFADSENNFGLEKLSPGLYRVRAEKADRLASFEEASEGWRNRGGGSSDSSVSVDLKDGQVVILTLDIPDSSVGKLTGVVNDTDDLGSGYSVLAIRENPSQKGGLNADGKDPQFGNYRTATADVNGVFEFPGLREANYRLYAIPRGKGLTPKNAIASDFVQVFANANARRDLFGRSGPLKGTVLRPNGQPMGSVNVIAVVNATRSPTPVLPAGTRFTARTRGDGAFNFGKLPGGAYDVTVEQAPFTRKTVGAEIFGATTQPLQIALEQPAKGTGKFSTTSKK